MKQTKNKESKINAKQIIEKVIKLLQIMMCETLAVRLVSMVLLSVGMENSRVTELTGLCDRSVRALKKKLENGEEDESFEVRGGGGKGKLADVEAEIAAEIEANEYHTRQEIADMVYEKYKIKISVWAIGRFLKKTKSNG